jgi:hypothetical protein
MVATKALNHRIICTENHTRRRIRKNRRRRTVGPTVGSSSRRRNTHSQNYNDSRLSKRDWTQHNKKSASTKSVLAERIRGVVVEV